MHDNTPSTPAPFDTLVVGGGSAGAVLAARLTENPGRTVLLLEAGPSYAPEGYPESVASSSVLGGWTGHDWGYRSEPGFIGHPVDAFRGKVLGGSSAVNGSVAVRALPSDFARWSERGLKGWSYEEVLPAFKALEATGAGDDARHGRTGPLPVTQLGRDDVSPMQRAFVDAALADGIPAVDDFNGTDPHGVGPYPMNVRDGVRVNTGMAYLTDAVRARPNLTVRAETLVDRVLFEGTRAVGVVLADGSEIRAREVILSAGAYGSAAALLRSGIGPADDLAALDIPVVADLPVGLRLQDHPFYYNAYAADPERIGAQTPVIGAKVWTASSAVAEGELDLHITATHLFDHASSPTGVGFVLAVALVRPQSQGTLTLVSRDPQDAPRIDLNFLAEPEDRHRLIEGIRLARRLGATEPLAGLVSSELNPGPQAVSDAEIEASALATLDTYHHPTSTAPMGADDDPTAVTDRLGAVRGVTGLRVVDASIFPDVPSAATNLTVIAAAEHIARQI
ncbi:dehydrogenase [Streptomyces spiroverticillatus]|uniref:Dehydrogenase n=1 Tax=Streptomyces finlayi TaxID=67296 RepID=A0A918WZY3_9ACTN|nr:GMC family oxidoreductase N-terminal domain-containing protein [Streptomyces finlayi]GHA17174.1 dehydrogenase [Streptomyces spiroverticillatus]GHC99174.1 dehydrogenase [Streptomyces finlayi]